MEKIFIVDADSRSFINVISSDLYLSDKFEVGLLCSKESAYSKLMELYEFDVRYYGNDLFSVLTEDELENSRFIICNFIKSSIMTNKLIGKKNSFQLESEFIPVNTWIGDEAISLACSYLNGVITYVPCKVNEPLMDILSIDILEQTEDYRKLVEKFVRDNMLDFAFFKLKVMDGELITYQPNITPLHIALNTEVDFLGLIDNESKEPMIPKTPKTLVKINNYLSI